MVNNENTMNDQKMNIYTEKLDQEIKRILMPIRDIGSILKELYGYENYVITKMSDRTIIMEYEIDSIMLRHNQLIHKNEIPYTFGIYEYFNDQITLIEYVHASSKNELFEKSSIINELLDDMIFKSDLENFKGD